MVAELGLRARLPSFSNPHARFPATMASPNVADIFVPTGIASDYVPTGMANWEPEAMSMQQCINMGAVGMVVLQAVSVAGGRMVQALYNRATKQRQLIYDQQGQLVDFPVGQLLALPPPPSNFNIDDDDRPTTPRPPQSSNENIGGQHAAVDPVDAAVSGAIQNLSKSKSQSPTTPVAKLFQSPTYEHEDFTLQMTDEQTKRDLDRKGLGKNGKSEEDLKRENILLRKKLLYYEQGTVTRMSPNASPDINMKDIADKLPQWAQTAMQTGNFPGPQLVEGCIVDVTNMVRVEMERIKTKTAKGPDPWQNYINNSNGGTGFGGAGGVNGGSPSINSSANSPGQWIAELAASGTHGNGGWGNGGEPTDSYGVTQGGGYGDDKRKEFTLVNPRNINIPIFTGKALNANPYLPFNNAIRRLILAQGADGEQLLHILDKVEKMGG